MAKQSKLAMDITKQQDAQTKMLSGSAWMTAGSIFFTDLRCYLYYSMGYLVG